MGCSGWAHPGRVHQGSSWFQQDVMVVRGLRSRGSHWRIPCHSESVIPPAMLSAIWAVPSLLGPFICFPWSWLFLSLGMGKRRGGEGLLVFFSHVSSAVKMCKIIKWGNRKWLPAPHSPAPQMFVCQFLSLLLPYLSLLSWMLIPSPCVARTFACRPGVPLDRVSILVLIISSAVDCDLWSSLGKTPQPPPVCRSWGWAGEWLEHRAPSMELLN